MNIETGKIDSAVAGPAMTLNIATSSHPDLAWRTPPYSPRDWTFRHQDSTNAVSTPGNL